jgi:hypothetical protein
MAMRKVWCEINEGNPWILDADLRSYSVPERAVRKQWFEDGCHLLHQCLLDYAIDDRGDAQISGSSPRLRYGDPLHRSRSIGAVAQLLMQPCKRFILSFRERGDRQAIDASTALVFPDMFPGFDQIGSIIDLVDQRMDFPMSLLSSEPTKTGV